MFMLTGPWCLVSVMYVVYTPSQHHYTCIPHTKRSIKLMNDINKYTFLSVSFLTFSVVDLHQSPIRTWMFMLIGDKVAPGWDWRPGL